MRRLFAAITGRSLTDTQTGLRGLPLAMLPELLELRGERYDYEMIVLAHLCRTGRAGSSPIELPIRTVYLESNRGSHFHPLWDSLRVVAMLSRAALRRHVRFDVRRPGE